MFRFATRVSTVALIVLALGLVTVSPASAAEARRPAGLTNWIANAIVFAQGFLSGSPAKPLSNRAAKASVPVSGGTYPGGGMQVNTGSCIDPMGNRVPCSQS